MRGTKEEGRGTTLRRYSEMGGVKLNGATYTPNGLSDFVAAQMMAVVDLGARAGVRILDPAAGDGSLLLGLLAQVRAANPELPVEVFGFETSREAAKRCMERIHTRFPDLQAEIVHQDFLGHILEGSAPGGQIRLEANSAFRKYDLIIANPPYVRTQVMGAAQAQRIATQFDLSGRVDLYYAFLIAISRALEPTGVAGIIVSNRFMTTRSGGPVRAAVSGNFRLCHVWDLGDTKLFDAAVLPAVLIVRGRAAAAAGPVLFSSIYETDQQATSVASDPLEALSSTGVVEVPDGRRFEVRHGRLNGEPRLDAVWSISNSSTDAWLRTVRANTWGTFRDIGKIRVGVKTCADSVYIRSDWDDLPASLRPELLRPLMTHHVARRFRAKRAEPARLILYPHEVECGRRRPVDLSAYPRSRAYLEEHRTALEQRKYLAEAGRAWYEIWVPQDPEAWDLPKLVFRDISKTPTFWLDADGSIVNGDCYWLASGSASDGDLLWLALAVANSTFIERFYDFSFHNKLYAGRRRFITQYVEQFPLPDPVSSGSREIVKRVKQLYNDVEGQGSKELAEQLDSLIWSVFGLSVEEAGR